jgi:hypothetical protein
MRSLAAFQDYTLCPDVLSNVMLEDPLDADEGFFRWGSMVLFGRVRGVATVKQASEPMADVDKLVGAAACGLRLPFDPTTVADSLRSERYIDNHLPGEDARPITPRAPSCRWRSGSICSGGRSGTGGGWSSRSGQWTRQWMR